MSVFVIADVTVKPEHVEKVKTELMKLLAPTREEEGCISYNLYQDKTNPAHLAFYEEWTSEDALNNHLQTEHVKQAFAATAGMIEEPKIGRFDRL